MKKLLLFISIFIFSQCFSFGTYPVIDVKAIGQAVKQLQELQGQTGILDEQTQLMIEELAVQWSTYDNALNMYETLGDADGVVDYVNFQESRWRSFLSNIGRDLDRWTSNPLEVRHVQRGIRRVLGRADRYNSTDDLIDALEDAERGITRRRWLQGVVGDGLSESEAEAKLADMSEQEVTKAMIDSSWNNQAIITQEMAMVREVNSEHKKAMEEVIATPAENVLSAQNTIKDMVANNTRVMIENSDAQQQILSAQTEAINVNNELIQREQEAELIRRQVKAAFKYRQ